MSGRQVRLGQLIAPFGPGSLYTDRQGTPLIICGLDHWYKRWDHNNGLQLCDKPEEFEIFDRRLSELLRVDRFKAPADFRFATKEANPPPNAFISTPALRFPCWYRNTRTGLLRRFNPHTVRLDNSKDGSWLAVRFVSVCNSGHLSEFPWKAWIKCSCPNDDNFILNDRGGSDLSSIHISCRTCPANSTGSKGKSLGGTTYKPIIQDDEESAFQRAGINCPGGRPWLGEGAEVSGCASPLIGALINQTNLYFPRTTSSIALPDIEQQDDELARLSKLIQEDPKIGLAKTDWRMDDHGMAVIRMKRQLSARGVDATDESIEAVLTAIFDNPNLPVSNYSKPRDRESELVTFRRCEFQVLRDGINDPEKFPNLRVVMRQPPDEIGAWFSRINLIERLRETRVFYGFDRLEPSNSPLADMPESAMQQLFREPPEATTERWLPAVEVFGEGIYFELSEDRLNRWQIENNDWLEQRLSLAFISRLHKESFTLPPLSGPSLSWASRFLLIHSLSHALINQLVFECGYSTASLRERLFVSDDAGAPMAGFMIYTAAGDSEGTLGGLVRLGRPNRILPLLLRALSRAAWCSADPVCAEQSGGTGSRLVNLAACHACVLLPETCCETINHGLDRAMVVGTPECREQGFMSELLQVAHSIG